MTPEPASSSAQAVVAGISAAVLAWTGITFHTLLWALIGSLAALVFINPIQQDGNSLSVRAVASILFSMLAGAVLAEVAEMGLIWAGAAEKAAATAHLGIAFVCGAGAKPFLIGAVERVTKVIGGKPNA